MSDSTSPIADESDDGRDAGKISESDERMVAFAVVALTAVAALVAWREAVIDFQYQLAGLADPFLGRPAPGMTMTIYVVLGILFRLGVWVGSFLTWGPSPRPRRRHGVRSPRWWWVLAGLWIGYALGGASVAAGGGPEHRPGNLTLTFGSPLSASVTVAAECLSATGSVEVATVTPLVGDAPQVAVRDPATGQPLRYPTAGAVLLQGVTGPMLSGGGALAIPGLPARPAMARLVAQTRLSGEPWLSDGGATVQLTPVPFVRAYDYEPLANETTALRGTATFTARRAVAPFTLNSLIADDPWPTTFPLAIEWRCDGSWPQETAPTAGAAAPAGPSLGDGSPHPVELAPLVWPSPVPVVGEGVPFEVTVATTGAWAILDLTGGTLADATVIDARGGGNGSVDVTDTGAVIRVVQPSANVTAGHVVSATIRLRLIGGAMGRKIGLTQRCGEEGHVVTTVSNLVAAEPVPVHVATGSWQDRPGWPDELDAGFLLTPVAVRTW